MKRKLTLFLSAVMAASSLPVTAYAANFKDINDVPWAAGVINSVADKGLVGGYEDNTFRGKNNVTYCEAMQMVYTLLTKTGAAHQMDAVSVYSYMMTLDAYNVPKWAQMAVAYGLSMNIIDMQMVVSKFAGGKTAATREDVAVIFGNAVGAVNGKERDTSGAQSFADYWSISSNALEQVSMLKKLGIISGDNYNRFNPKNNINRAEMAVMLNNTYDVLIDGLSYSGEITELDKNTGADGTNYYYIAIKTDEGRTEGFSVTDGALPVYVGNTSETMAIGKLSKGDDVVFMISGTELVSIRLIEGITDQEKYDITGYVNSIKDNTLSLENENTGESKKYHLDSGVSCYVEGEKVTRKELENIMKEHYKDYAYAGVNTEVKREKNDAGNYENVTYVTELYITFSQEYTVVGEVQKFNNQNISLKLADSSAQKTISLGADCEFFIADEKVDFDEMKKLADAGTTYAKVAIDATDHASSVIMSEDTFANAKELEESKSYKLTSFTDKKLVLKDGDDKLTYEFGTKNPVDNINFFVWDDNDPNDNDDDEWVEYRDIKDTETEVDKLEDDGDVYVKVLFNSGGRLSEIYFSNDRKAWAKSEEFQTERKGTVASVEDDVLKFKTSAIEYELLKSYDSGHLKLHSVKTQSKTMLSKLANADDLELYAEIKANGDNEVVELEAYVKAAEGKLVEFHNEKDDSDDYYYVEIETADGTVLKLVSQRSPKLTDEEEDKFELKDIAGPNSRYVGETVTLGFNSSGVVNQITVGSGPKSSDASVKVKGIAVAADDGLQVEGDSTVYRWLSKKADISVRNYSGPSESVDTVKAMIEDPDVEVYVEATLDDKERVEGIRVYVREAEGTLQSMDDNVRIKTDSGNAFSFYKKNKLATCNVNGYGQEDIEDRDKGLGAYVKLTFEDGGDVNGIESK